jgi:hypothetical protein
VNTNISSGLYVRGDKNLGRRDQRVRRLTRKMRACMPWLADADLPACRGWAEMEILANRAYQILSSVPIINRDGEPLRLLTDFRQLRQAQIVYARELGMTPSARLALQIASEDKALDLAAIASEYRDGAADAHPGAQDAPYRPADGKASDSEGDHDEEEG